MKTFCRVSIALSLLSCSSASLAAQRPGCETSKSIIESQQAFESSFSGTSNQTQANSFVPVIISGGNGMSFQDRFQPRATLADCKKVIQVCGGKWLSEPNIKGFCVKAGAQRQLEKIIQIRAN